jgi:hypothetical protein
MMCLTLAAVCLQLLAKLLSPSTFYSPSARARVQGTTTCSCNVNTVGQSHGQFQRPQLSGSCNISDREFARVLTTETHCVRLHESPLPNGCPAAAAGVSLTAFLTAGLKPPAAVGRRLPALTACKATGSCSCSLDPDTRALLPHRLELATPAAARERGVRWAACTAPITEPPLLPLPTPPASAAHPCA